MGDDHKKKIQNNYELLKDSLEPEALADFLFSKCKITTEQHESINVTNDKKGKYDASRKCLKILLNSGPDTYECLKEFLKSDKARHFILDKLEQEMVEDIRVVMFGKTGVGKSLLGNKIMCQNIFSAQGYAQSVTIKPTRGERLIGNNCKLVLTDTPGLFDTSIQDNLKTAKILASTVKETKPGPHIFIFVLSIGRFTAEDRVTVEFLKDLFGVHVTDYLIIVFTRKDDLDYNKIDLKTYIDKAGEDLKSLVSQCKGVMAINNRAPDEEVKESVDSLVKMIQDVYLKNNKQHYRDELLVEAQKQFDEKLRLQEEEAHRRERELEARNKKLEEEKDMITQQKTKLEEYHDKQQLQELKEYFMIRENETKQLANRLLEEAQLREQKLKVEMMKLKRENALKKQQLQEFNRKEKLECERNIQKEEEGEDTNHKNQETKKTIRGLEFKIKRLINARSDMEKLLRFNKYQVNELSETIGKPEHLQTLEESSRTIQIQKKETLIKDIKDRENIIQKLKEEEKELTDFKDYIENEIITNKCTM